MIIITYNIFNEGSRSSRQFITKRIRCKETCLLLTKEEYLSPYQLDLYFNDLYFNDFTLYYSFQIRELNAAVKLVLLQPFDHKYFLVKTVNAPISSTANESSPQPLSVLQIFDSAVNRKPCTCRTKLPIVNASRSRIVLYCKFIQCR